MSGVVAGKAPSTDAQWARDVQQQLDALSNPLTARVGDWVLSQGSDGSLQASSPVVPPFALSAVPSLDGLAGQLTEAQLPGWLQNLTAAAPGLVTIGGAFTSLQTDYNDFISGDWTGLLTNLFGTTTPSSTNWLTSAEQWIVDQFNQLAYGNTSTGNSLNSVTAAIQALLSSIPSSSITDDSLSSQLVPDFPTASSLVPGAGWDYDPVNGLVTAGCAQYLCSGNPGSLYGNWIPVSENDVMSPQAHAAWTGLTFIGSPVALNLRTDTGILENIATLTPTGPSSSTYPGSILGDAGTLYWVPMTGSYTVPSGVAFVRSELAVGATATAGYVEFDDAPDIRSTSWLNSQFDNINADFGDIYDAFATGNAAELTTAWDNLMSLFSSSPSAMVTGPSSSSFWTTIITDLINPLNAIETQASNIIGIIEQEAVSGVTTLWDWLSGTSAAVASNATTGAMQGAANTNTLQAIAANPPAFVGLMPGTQSNITLPGPLMAPLSAYQTTQSLIGFVRIQQPMTVGAIGFIAAGPSGGTLTDFYLNFYKLDATTGDLDYLFSSANIALSIPAYGSENWVEYAFPGPDQISAVAGDIIAAEFQVVASADPAYVYGQNTGVPNRTSAVMQNVGGTRSSPGTSVPTGNIASTDFSFSPPAPYVALEPTDFPADYEPPVQTQYLTAGTYTYTLPGWFNLGVDYLDVIAVGDGGGGGGGLGGAGSPGDGTTVLVTTVSGVQTLTATPGAGGISGVAAGSAYLGYGPGNDVLNGLNAYGGTTVNWGQPGGSPGGGGGGAQYFDFFGYGALPGSFNAATYQPTATTVAIDIGPGGAPNMGGFTPGAGAPGGVWLQARQA